MNWVVTVQVPVTGDHVFKTDVESRKDAYELGVKYGTLLGADGHDTYVHVKDVRKMQITTLEETVRKLELSK